MSAAPSPHDYDDGIRLARLEGTFAAECDRRREMDDLHRKERAESEARVMAEVKASEDRTGKRIDGVLAKVDATNGKIDTLVEAFKAGRNVSPANTDDTGSGSSSFYMGGKIHPWMWKALIAAMTGAGVVGGGLRALQEDPPAQTVNVTASP